MTAFEMATQAKEATSEQLAAVWHWHGEALSFLNRYEEGLASVEEAIALDPKNLSYYFLKGWFLGQLKRYEEESA